MITSELGFEQDFRKSSLFSTVDSRRSCHDTLFSVFLGYLEKFVWDLEGFIDDLSLDKAEDFGLGPIHDDSFGGRKIVCTPLNKLWAMGGLVNTKK